MTATDSASQPTRWYLGMMSGTSYDAIDVALLRTDGVSFLEHGPAQAFPLQPELRQRIAAAKGRASAPPELSDAITQAHVEAVRGFRGAYPEYDIKAIGFHGQTILHQPRDRLSIQLGEGGVLAQATGLAVVGQFRLRDLAAGGEGAPIAPIYHEALLRSGPLPSVQVNIGGVSNVTWADGDRLIAFDCGPGCAKIDDWMARAGRTMDRDGEHGLAGMIDERMVQLALSDEFFARSPPKSLDRDELIFAGVDMLSVADGAATLAAITADAIATTARWFPSPPRRWIVGGGGRRNRAIMNRLQACLGASVVTTEEAGQDGDAVEAYMIAYLAARYFAGLPITFPATTGADRPCPGGELFLPIGAKSDGTE
jgi:anhydro-N-acetylmuramic acid kinase